MLETQNRRTKGRVDLCSSFSIEARREFPFSFCLLGNSSSLEFFQRRVQAMNHFILAYRVARYHEDVGHFSSKIDRFGEMDRYFPWRATGKVIEDRAVLAGAPSTQLVGCHPAAGQTRDTTREHVNTAPAQLRSAIKLHANPVSHCLSQIVGLHRPGSNESRCFSTRQQSTRTLGLYPRKDCISINARL
ncbi:MAG: hypothetical protein ACRD06_09260 [Terriglobia bacterium]